MEVFKTAVPMNIRGRAFGGRTPLICAPMVGKTSGELMDEAKMVLEALPDCAEWRADYFDNVEDAAGTARTARKICGIIPDVPLIFTLRITEEGGFKHIDQQTRLRIIKEVICSGQIDVVDIELCNGPDFLAQITETAKKHNVYTIISNHHFRNTPKKETLLQILEDERRAGADIVKLAVMPACPADVLALLDATNDFTSLYPTIPAITVSMGGLGVISRLGGGVFGSAVTFGTLKQASAPGQISVAELKSMVGVIYGNRT